MLTRIWGKSNPWIPVLFMKISLSTMGIRINAYEQTKNRTVIWFSYTTPGCITEWMLAYNRDVCTPMFIVALLAMTKLWNYTRFPPIDGLIDKESIIPIEYYSTINNEIMSFTGKWMESGFCQTI